MVTQTISPSIEECIAPYAPFFRRLEGKELAECYVTGLVMEGERKSVEPMSQRVNVSERGMQRLLTEVKWDHEGASSVSLLRSPTLYSKDPYKTIGYAKRLCIH